MEHIKKISDLVVNENVEYDDCHKTELFFEAKGVLHLAYFKEIGIGLTKQEAFNNYGKFKYEENDKFFDSIKKLEVNANFLRTLNSIRIIEQRLW